MTDLFNLTPPSLRCLPFSLPEIDGYSYVWDDSRGGFVVKIPRGQFFYSERFFNSRWSDRAVEYFLTNSSFDWKDANWRNLPPSVLSEIDFENIKWRQDYMKLYGKKIPLPRLTAWYGDPGRSYQYSGIKSDPHPWNDGLLRIKERVERCSNHLFNCVLLNWYRDGQDSLSWHADDEKELGLNPVIGSANFGATREFIIRNNSDHSQKVSIPLKHGTLLVMEGEMQHYWQHSIPKRTKIDRSRFNLTFRSIS